MIREDVERYSDLMQKMCEEHQLLDKPQLILNVDETDL
jgi:hypothetical protein